MNRAERRRQTRTDAVTPLAVRLIEPGAWPLWLGLEQQPCTYYRCELPAQAVGGTTRPSLAFIPFGETRPRRLVLEEPETLDPLVSATGVTLIGAGSPTVFHLGSVLGPATTDAAVGQWARRARTLARLIAGMVTAGVAVWIDSDDALLGGPEEVRAWFNTAQLHPAAVRDREADRFYTAVETVTAPIITAASGLIASTEAVAASFRRFNPNVVVIENAIDPAAFAPLPRAAGPLHIGFGGTQSHHRDVCELALLALIEAARRPGVVLHFYGWHPQIALLSSRAEPPGVYAVDGVRYVYHGEARPTPAYYQRIACLDVAVAPLRDTVVNQARSAGKWLEHSMLGTAMVVSDETPYRCVQDGVTALKARSAEDFGRQLTRLLDDAELRRRIGQAAREDVLRNHTISARAPQWRAWLARADRQPAVIA